MSSIGQTSGNPVPSRMTASAVPPAGNTVPLPPNDEGKTWGNPSWPSDLNFGHHTRPDASGQQQLFAVHPSGAIIWADNGKRLTPDQWANMPQREKDKILQMVPEQMRGSFLGIMNAGHANVAQMPPKAGTNHISTTASTMAVNQQQAQTPAAVLAKAQAAGFNPPPAPPPINPQFANGIVMPAPQPVQAGGGPQFVSDPRNPSLIYFNDQRQPAQASGGPQPAPQAADVHTTAIMPEAPQSIMGVNNLRAAYGQEANPNLTKYETGAPMNH